MGRSGCAICGAVLQPFAYKAIGLCNSCRSKVAKKLGTKKSKVDCVSITIEACTRNLTKQEIDNFFGGDK